MMFTHPDAGPPDRLRDAVGLATASGLDLLTLGVDQAAAPIVVLGAEGVVQHINPAATRMLGRSCILRLRDERLHLNRREERAALRDATATALLAAREGRALDGAMVVLHDRQNCPVMVLHLRPVIAAGLPPLASIRIADMLTPAAIEPTWIVRVFGLTQAEARVAAGLFDGLDLREIADRQAVALETVRGHLKRGMVKVGARSQAQLVRMLASSYGVIDHNLTQIATKTSSPRKN